jgi:hypothetical protein
VEVGSSTPEPYEDLIKALLALIDGDTLDLDLDLDFSLVLRQRVRLHGLDAPKVRTRDAAEKEQVCGQRRLCRPGMASGPACRAFAANCSSGGWQGVLSQQVVQLTRGCEVAAG